MMVVEWRLIKATRMITDRGNDKKMSLVRIKTIRYLVQRFRTAVSIIHNSKATLHRCRITLRSGYSGRDEGTKY